MSEFVERPNRILIESIDLENVQAITNIVEAGARRPREEGLSDPVETAFFRAATRHLWPGGKLRPHLDEIVALRRMRGSYFTPAYLLRSIEFGIDKQLRRDYPNFYPWAFGGRATWEHYRVFDKLDYDELLWDAQQNLRSSIADGYGTIKLLTQVFGGRWHQPTVVDVGTGFAAGLNKLKMHDEFPFVPEEVLSSPGPGEPVSPYLKPDVASQAIVDHHIGQPPLIGRAFGLDIWPVGQSEKALGYSSTFPMSQSAIDPQGAEEFSRLIDAAPPGVTVESRRYIDATDPESLAQLSEVLPDGKADVFIFSGVIIQISPSKMRNLFTNFLPYSNKRALFIVNEWANANQSFPGGLEMMKRDYWHKGQFKTFIIDPFNLGMQPVEFCRHLNRRCQQMYLSKAGRKLLEQSV